MSVSVEALVRIAALSKSITESERNINDLLELIEYLQCEEDVLVKTAIAALDHVYSHLTQKDPTALAWLLPPSSAQTQDRAPAEGDVLRVYQSWMRSTYGSCRDQLLCLLLHPQHSVADLVLDLLMKMVGWEGHAQSHDKRYSFPNHLFHAMVSRLLDNTMEGNALIGRCDKWLAYHDVLFHWLKNIASVVNTKLDAKKSYKIPEHFVENVYSALQAVAMPTDEDDIVSFLCGSPPKVQRSSSDGAKKTKSASKSEGVWTLQRHQKHFSDAWLAFLQLPLPPRLLRQVLVGLHSSVMPNLVDPRLLLDFLTSAYDCGGVVSILALNGLFILMNKFHLDYPTFYPKLYQLLQPSVLYVKYSARFFRLLDTFLTSSHLSLYLVAAFIKKLARLSLTAPPEGVVLAVVMVTNLTKRHPNCRVLLHRTNMEDFDLTHDPFDLDEPDPAESRALESCLWELKTLQSHYCPGVSKLVKQLLSPDSLTSRMETNLQHHLNTLDQYKVIEFKTAVGSEPALNYKEPTSLWQQGKS